MTETRATTTEPARTKATTGTRSPWRSAELAGAAAAFAVVALVLVPVGLVFAAPVPPADGAGVLVFIAEHRAVYLAELICFVGLAVPALIVFVAVALALRARDPGIALLGGVLGVASETIALALGSSPQSLHGGLIVLSDAYAVSDSGRRQALVAAAEALIAATNAVSWAGILTAAAILVLSLLMGRGGFGPALAVFGVVTGVLGIGSEAFRSEIGIAYLAYGLLLPTWFAFVGWRLLHPRAGARRPVSSGDGRGEALGPDPQVGP